MIAYAGDERAGKALLTAIGCKVERDRDGGIRGKQRTAHRHGRRDPAIGLARLSLQVGDLVAEEVDLAAKRADRALQIGNIGWAKARITEIATGIAGDVAGRADLC